MSRPLHLPFLTSLTMFAVACASAPPAKAPSRPVALASPPTGGPGPVAATAAPAAMPNAIHWARNSAEHEAALLQAFREATRLVEERARGREPGSWGVVSDADETLIDNSTYFKERAELGLPFTRPSWREWCARREAKPLAGALGFAERVRSLGGRLVVVTNRTGEECPDLEANLQAIGLPFDALLCRASATDLSKQPRFERVEAGTAAAGLPPLEVVLYVGDNVLDFPGLAPSDRNQPEKLAEFGRRFVIVPNPIYGSWELLPRQ